MFDTLFDDALYGEHLVPLNHRDKSHAPGENNKGKLFLPALIKNRKKKDEEIVDVEVIDVKEDKEEEIKEILVDLSKKKDKEK